MSHQSQASLTVFSKIKIYLQNHARPISLKLQLVFWRQGTWKKMTNFPGIIKHNSTSWGGVTCRSSPATKNKHPVEAPCPNLIHILWLSSDLRCRKPGGCVRRSYKKNGSGRRKFHHIEVVNQPENQMAGKSWLNLRLLPRQGFWQAASFMSSSGSFTFSLLRTVTLSCTTRTVVFIKVSGRMIKTQLSVGI